MKVFRWFTAISMVASAALGAYRLYRNWQMTREEETARLESSHA